MPRHFLLVFEYDILIGYALAAREAAAFDQLRQFQMSGSYLSQAQYRLQNFWYFRQESFLVLPLNIALFSLGMLLHRARVFSTSPEGAMLRRRLAWTGLGIGGPATLLMFSSWDGGLFFARYLAAPVFAVGYLSVISAAVLNTSASGILSAALASIGRTALSCYVLQNIICSVIFFGWGFGLKGTVGPFATMAIYLAIAAGLAVASGAWLRRRSRGPLEAASHQAMKAMRAA